MKSKADVKKRFKHMDCLFWKATFERKRPRSACGDEPEEARRDSSESLKRERTHK